MITELFNQNFEVQRNYPSNINGMLKDNYAFVQNVKGRISSPGYNEYNIYANRSMILKAVIYLDVYNYDEQRDIIIGDDGVKYKIDGITAYRNRHGDVAYLKLPVTESTIINAGGSGSES